MIVISGSITRHLFCSSSLVDYKCRLFFYLQRKTEVSGQSWVHLRGTLFFCLQNSQNFFLGFTLFSKDLYTQNQLYIKIFSFFEVYHFDFWMFRKSWVILQFLAKISQSKWNSGFQNSSFCTLSLTTIGTSINFVKGFFFSKKKKIY